VRLTNNSSLVVNNKFHFPERFLTGLDLLKYIAILILPLGYLTFSSCVSSVRLSTLLRTSTTRPEQTPAEKEQLKTVMQSPRMNLAPPKDDPFTIEQLRELDGTDLSKPIYVAINGWFIIVKMITPQIMFLY